MLFGQSDSEGGGILDTIADIGGAMIGVPAAILNKIQNSVSPSETPGDGGFEIPPSGDAAATSVVGASKRSAGNRTQAEGESPVSDYPSTQTGASVWPWLLGVGLISGGAYLFLRRRKRKDK